MTAFVPAIPVSATHRSSFATNSLTQVPTTFLPSTRRSVLPTPSYTVLNRMSLDQDTEQARNAPTNFDNTKLFVGNLSWDTDDKVLKEAFSAYGEVVDARVITDRYTGKSRGFGFVEYDAAAHATEALEAMNGAEIDGRNVRVDRAESRPRQFRPRNDDFRPRNDDFY